MKVFRLNEYEAWFAESKGAAIAAHRETTGCSIEEILDDLYFKEYTKQELKEMTLKDAWSEDANCWELLQQYVSKGHTSGFLFGWE